MNSPRRPSLDALEHGPGDSLSLQPQTHKRSGLSEPSAAPRHFCGPRHFHRNKAIEEQGHGLPVGEKESWPPSSEDSLGCDGPLGRTCHPTLPVPHCISSLEASPRRRPLCDSLTCPRDHPALHVCPHFVPHPPQQRRAACCWSRMSLEGLPNAWTAATSGVSLPTRESRPLERTTWCIVAPAPSTQQTPKSCFEQQKVY
mmetsp:Transcript_2260/g.8085  ORF Transcript_2260/g.8085 Transcript_2260/m.8085 type:complete len:200 (+) Transcript_2260:260-859(+)